MLRAMPDAHAFCSDPATSALVGVALVPSDLATLFWVISGASLSEVASGCFTYLVVVYGFSGCWGGWGCCGCGGYSAT